MNFDCGIYSIVSPSGKQYIGQAQSFKTRWAGHKHRLKRGNHHCRPLQNAWNKYGEEAFLFVKIAIVPPDQLIAREQEQFDAFISAGTRDSLYNTSLCAEAARRGMPISTEAKAKISASRIGKYTGEEHGMFGRKHTEEAKAKMGAPKKGKKLTQEHRAKIRASAPRGEKNPNFGKQLSESRKAELSSMWAGEKSIWFGVTGANHPASRAVLCVTNNMTFASGLAAVQWLRQNGHPKADNSTISAACSGKVKTAYGFQWKRPD